MFDLAALQSIERDTGLTYPQAFKACAEAFWEVTQSLKFAKHFPRAHLLTTASDVRAAYRDGLPARLLPFLAQVQPQHTDYYAFDKSGAVCVFAIHAVVEQWSDFAIFLDWLQTLAGV